MKRALMTELKSFVSLIPEKRPKITSIFFGGGTPSLAEPDTFRTIIDFLKTLDTDSELEVTMEANPTSIEMTKMKLFADAGVNRVSLGIQALNDSDLAFLGRKHSTEDSLKAIQLCQQLFKRVSFDLIYGRHKDQLPHLWQQELQQALSLNTGHLSLYNLTIEKGTPFYKLQSQGKDMFPDADHQAQLYDIAVEEMSKRGYNQYEISNFAIPTNECRHNINYWNGGDYIGIGPGAAGRITDGSNQRYAFSQLKNPTKWMDQVLTTGFGTDTKEQLSKKERIMELILTGLRTSFGISLSQFQKIGFEDPKFNIDDFVDMRFISSAEKEGYLLFHDGVLKATPKGQKILDTLLLDIIK